MSRSIALDRFVRPLSAVCRLCIPGAVLGIGLTFSVSCGGAPDESAGAGSRRGLSSEDGEFRNVVLICLDCLRPDHLGAYGYDEREASSWIDELAQRSTVFESAWAASSWTKSSVPSYLTGLQPIQHGVYEGVLYGEDRALSDGLPESATSVAEVFQESLYDTACIASNAQISQEFGFGQGFDHFVNDHMSGAEVLHAGIRWLRERDDSAPYFLYLHCIDTHWPYRIPEEFQTHYAAAEDIARIDLDGGTEWQKAVNRGDITLDPAQVDTWKRLYDGALRYDDHLLRILMDLLDEEDGARETVICVISDHGEELFEYGVFGHGANLRNEVLKVPFILHVPGEEARREAQHVSLVDLPGYLLDSSGLEITHPSTAERPRADGGVFGEVALPLGYLQSWIHRDHKLVREYRATPRLREQLGLSAGRLRADEIRSLVRLGPAKARAIGWTVTDSLYELDGREDQPLSTAVELKAALGAQLDAYSSALLGFVADPAEAEISSRQLEELRALGYR